MTNHRDDTQADGDPRLTAYALGELDAIGSKADLAEVEALLARDPAARAEVEAVRAAAAELRESFAAETAGAPAPSLTAAQKAEIERAAREPVRPRSRRVLLAWLPPLAAAAAVTVWMALGWPDDSKPSSSTNAPAGGPVAVNEPRERSDVSDAQLDQLKQLGYLGGASDSAARSAGEADALMPRDAVGQESLADQSAQSAGAAVGFAQRRSDVAKGDSAEAHAPLVEGSRREIVASNEGETLPAEDPSEPTAEQREQLAALGYIGGGSSGGGAAAPPTNPGGAAAPGPGAPSAGASQSGSSGMLTGQGREESSEVAMRRPNVAAPAAAKLAAAPAKDPAALGEAVAADVVADDREQPRFRYLRVAPTPGTELYMPIVETGFASPFNVPYSTFGVDVDTAAYSNVRRFLNNGQLPPADAVRLEELLNYFRYDDPAPAAGAECPFAVTVDVTDCPWAPTHRLARVALKGREVPAAQRGQTNLVFLLDVSGSMDQSDKLPLLVASMKLLAQQLDERDRVAIVTYAGSAGLVLDSTVCDGPGRQRVLDALDNLRAGGSTAGAAGIQLAYQVATQNFRQGGTNRVLLATDGDFNVGATSREELQSLIENSAKTGTFLTVLGFGEGNLKDGTAELLADKGNGQYAYIDSLDEGRRVLVQQMGGTLVTIAKDVKLQLEFNPARVQAYRLLGYENRALAPQDFRDDRKDAGDIGAGHSVVALYELVPPGAETSLGIDPLKYQKQAEAPKPELVPSDELLTVKLRWKEPAASASTEMQLPVRDGGATLAEARADVKFSAAVAAFGMLLRNSANAGSATWAQVIALGEAGRGADPDGWRAEFVRLAKMALQLQGPTPQERALQSIGYLGEVKDNKR
jgi:Ca-activated chloride channel homolog